MQHPAFQDFLLFLIILNPFGQMVYLSDLINATDVPTFRRIFLRANIMTFCVCLLCAVAGQIIIFDLFHVSLEAMRIFGGLVTLYLAFNYVMRGPEGLRLFRGDIAEMAQQVTLPAMVGAGVVWVCMKIGGSHSFLVVMSIILAVLLVNAIAVLLYHTALHRAQGVIQVTLIKYFGIAMRLNAMLIGAVAVDMILGGITEYKAGL